MQKNHIITSLFLFVFALFVTVPNAAVTPQGPDGTEFATAAVVNALVHPPGYPWYMMISRVLVHIFDSNPFYTLSVFSAVCHALSVLILYLLVISLKKNNLLAISVALSWLMFEPALKVATFVEVFAFHHLLSLSFLFFVFRLFYNEHNHDGLLVGLLFGIGGAHHQTIVLWLPFALVLILYKKRFIPFLIGSLIGLSGYLFLLTTEPTLVYHQINSFSDLWKHVLRYDYGTFKLHTGSDHQQVTFIYHFFDTAFKTMPLYLVASILILLLALARQQIIFIALLITNIFFLWFAYNLKLAEVSTIFIEMIHRFYGALGLLLIVNFLVFALQFKKERYILIMSLLILTSVAATSSRSLGSSEAKTDLTVHYELEEILKIPQGQVFISSSDRMGMAMYYKQLVENQRNDIILIHSPLLSSKRYQHYLNDRYPELELKKFDLVSITKHLFEKKKQIYAYFEAPRPAFVKIFPIGVVWQWIPLEFNITNEYVYRNLFQFCSEWPEDLKAVNTYRENSILILNDIYLKPFYAYSQVSSDREVANQLSEVIELFNQDKIIEAKEFCSKQLSAYTD